MKSSKKEMDPIIIAVSTAWVVEQAGIYDTRGLPKEIDLSRVTELSSLGLTEQQHELVRILNQLVSKRVCLS